MNRRNGRMKGTAIKEVQGNCTVHVKQYNCRTYSMFMRASFASRKKVPVVGRLIKFVVIIHDSDRSSDGILGICDIERTF